MPTNISVGSRVKPGSTQAASRATPTNAVGGSWVRSLDTFTVTLPGVYRVSFELGKSSNAATVEGRIYIDGVPRGLTRSVSGANVSFTEDISVHGGGRIEFWGRVVAANSGQNIADCSAQVLNRSVNVEKAFVVVNVG